MNDSQLLRYSRQILLPDIGITGQEKLLATRVLIIGIGGLGSPVALYLAASGIGQLTLVDFDQVEISNLQRQIIHNTTTLGQQKVLSAKTHIHAINPDIDVQTIDTQLDPKTLLKQVKKHDIVVDASDNFPTRFAINQACVMARKPLVSGAVIRMEGQVTTFDLSQTDTSCYRCLYNEASETDETEDTCSTNGVLAPVTGIIGSIQSTEVLKIALGLPTLQGRLLLLDAKYMQWRSINLKQDPHCPHCG